MPQLVQDEDPIVRAIVTDICARMRFFFPSRTWNIFNGCHGIRVHI